MTSRSREQQRVVVSPSGVEGALWVADLGDGRYRIQDLVGLSSWCADEVPEDAAYGWILEAEELEDGRLEVTAVVPDESIEVIEASVPKGFGESPAFWRLAKEIHESGGHVEVAMGGLLSAFVPRDSAGELTCDLREALRAALEAWQESM